MSDLTRIEREARQVRDFIAELKGLTPRFNATKERADEELSLHLAKIDTERAKLAELIDAAAVIVQHLGADVPAPEADEDFEPVIAMADSPQEDTWVLEVTERTPDAELVEELFEEAPHEQPEPDALHPMAGSCEDEVPVFVSDDHVESLGLTADDEARIDDFYEPQPDPTFEYVAAAVEQIASPPPPAPDATDEPELTDEQVERVEERLANPDPITAAEADPERELETVGAYVNVLPRKTWPWMGS